MNGVGDQSVPFYHPFGPKLGDGERARVFGVVTAVRESKNSFFFDLLHTLGSIQIVALRDSMGDVWDQIRAIRPRDRIKVSGTIGPTKKGEKSLFLDRLPLSAGAFLDETLASINPDFKQIGAALLIAQARTAAETYLSREQYRRIDPKYVSASWPADRGMNPLHVSYPGFGLPVYLAPSPAQQLSLAIAATGDDRVFCSATSFTTSYRQPSDGVETAIVMAMALGLSLDDLLSNAMGLINAVCASMPGTDLRYSLASAVRMETPLANLVTHRAGEDCAIWVHPCDSEGVQPFRIVLKGGVSPIEGCLELHEGGIAVGMLVLHLERMLPLAEHVQFRRLRHLGPDLGKDPKGI